jgi:predicted dehydrogenase
MNDSVLRAAVVGVGALGQHHARVYSQLPGVRLAGVYDADPARAAEIAARHGTAVFPDLAALRGAVDFASVVVPTDRHRAVAGELLEAGLHLLVEKPIAATAAEAEELVRLAEAAGRVLQVGHIERYNPVMEKLDGLPGQPRYIEADRLAPFPPPRPGAAPRGTEVSVVLDLMIHDIEIALHLARSPVREVRAAGLPVMSPSEDIAKAWIEFESGCVACLSASRISPARERRLRVFFADAYASLDYQEQAALVRRRTATGIEEERMPVEKDDQLTRELADFAACVRGQGTPRVSGRAAAEAMRVAERILAALRGTRA